ncbi:MAG: dephospho-CoA kinase [Eubacteriales bacterium]|jgi:dephospho-CoA kinase|nr:dephospho-CoA kinase [Eubacteriales bacterium]
MVIGVTGGSGSGKSFFCKEAKKLGFHIIDADGIGHKVLLRGNPAYDEVVGFFGKEILSENGEINRKRLGEIVFSSKDKLQKLNSITHFRISEKIDEIIQENKDKNILIDAALLFESGMDAKCDKVIAILAPKDVRIKRIMERDGLIYEKALKRINSQSSDEFYRLRADFVLQNDGRPESFARQAVALLEEVTHGKN